MGKKKKAIEAAAKRNIKAVKWFQTDVRKDQVVFPNDEINSALILLGGKFKGWKFWFPKKLIYVSGSHPQDRYSLHFTEDWVIDLKKPDGTTEKWNLRKFEQDVARLYDARRNLDKEWCEVIDRGNPTEFFKYVSMRLEKMYEEQIKKEERIKNGTALL